MLSIITPSFQQGQYIRRTLESVLERQDYPFVEHIVVDGLSTDGTLEILKEYQSRFPEKMRYLYEKDYGQADAINKGFKRLTGDIVGWINSDDYYEDNIFAYIVDFFERHADVDMIYGRCNLVNATGQFIGTFEDDYGFKVCGINKHSVFSYDILMNVYSGLIPQQTVFFRRRVFEKVGYLDDSYNLTMDYEFWLRIGRQGTIVCVDKLLANFRSHGEAKTNFKNRYNFIAESLRAREANGGRFACRFYVFVAKVAIKTFAKQLCLRWGILKS
ncbi:MAG: glycosyltransferase family 2 protein [Candidatus Omnitrophota bacterium]